jgi:hypothetical protein
LLLMLFVSMFSCLFEAKLNSRLQKRDGDGSLNYQVTRARGNAKEHNKTKSNRIFHTTSDSSSTMRPTGKVSHDLIKKDHREKEKALSTFCFVPIRANERLHLSKMSSAAKFRHPHSIMRKFELFRALFYAPP